MATTQKDKNELTEALKVIIPKVYGPDSMFKDWRIEVISPMPKLTGFEVNYYNMATNFCGKDVANHSWFV